jgi:hypothetical protein
MARITRLKTSPDTLLEPGEGLRRLFKSTTIRRQRQAAEIKLAGLAGSKNEKARAAAQAEVATLKLQEKHLKENGNGVH